MSSFRSPVGAPGLNLAALFASSGFLLATWGSRLPAMAEAADITGSRLGLLVGAMAAGTLLAMVYAGRYAHAHGPRSCILMGTWTSFVALLVTAPFADHEGVLVFGAVLLGAGNGIYDVGINTRAGWVARRERAPRLMPWLHGFWSVGALAGAGTAAVAARVGVPLWSHLTIAAALASVLSISGLRKDAAHGRQRSPGRSPWDLRPVVSGLWPAQPPRLRPRNTSVLRPQFSGWSHRTVSLGLIALGAAAAESTANEWLTLALTDPRGYGAQQSLAAGLLGVFVIGMVVTRFGSHLILRGEQVVRGMGACVLLVVVGTSLVILAGYWLDDLGIARWAVAVAGLLAWGCGAALGVPVAMALAAKTPRETEVDTSNQPERVSTIIAIGYGTFMVSPALLGGIGQGAGFLWTLLFAPIVMVIAFGGAMYVHPRGQQLVEQAVQPRSADTPAATEPGRSCTPVGQAPNLVTGMPVSMSLPPVFPDQAPPTLGGIVVPTSSKLRFGLHPLVAGPGPQVDEDARA